MNINDIKCHKMAECQRIRLDLNKHQETVFPLTTDYNQLIIKTNQMHKNIVFMKYEYG